MKRIDQIRKMDVEELTKFLLEYSSHAGCNCVAEDDCIQNGYTGKCKDNVRRWLEADKSVW